MTTNQKILLVVAAIAVWIWWRKQSGPQIIQPVFYPGAGTLGTPIPLTAQPDPIVPITQPDTSLAQAAALAEAVARARAAQKVASAREVRRFRKAAV